jgi:predicted metalloprotease
LAAAAASVIVLAGCGGGGDSTSAASGATGVSVPSADQVPLDGPPDPSLTVREIVPALPLPGPVADDPAFHEALDILIAASHKYWAESLDRNYEYHTPDEFIAYDGKAGDAGPDCGGEPMGIENAAYCRVPGESEYGLIGWDESGLLYPMYKQLGDGAVAFVIAHEYAHLAQDRIGTIQQFPLTVEKELNADCLAGAQWTGYDTHGADFSQADIRSIIDGITVVGDQPGTAWQDIHAHGSAEQRTQVFFDGYQHDPDYCITHYGPGFSGA